MSAWDGNIGKSSTSEGQKTLAGRLPHDKHMSKK